MVDRRGARERRARGTDSFGLMVMLPEPISPETENLTPSLVTEMVTVSPRMARSRQMRWNSAEGIWTVHL